MECSNPLNAAHNGTTPSGAPAPTGSNPLGHNGQFILGQLAFNDLPSSINDIPVLNAMPAPKKQPTNTSARTDLNLGGYHRVDMPPMPLSLQNVSSTLRSDEPIQLSLKNNVKVIGLDDGVVHDSALDNTKTADPVTADSAQAPNTTAQTETDAEETAEPAPAHALTDAPAEDVPAADTQYRDQVIAENLELKAFNKALMTDINEHLQLIAHATKQIETLRVRAEAAESKNLRIKTMLVGLHNDVDGFKRNYKHMLKDREKTISALEIELKRLKTQINVSAALEVVEIDIPGPLLKKRAVG